MVFLAQSTVRPLDISIGGLPVYAEKLSEV